MRVIIQQNVEILWASCWGGGKLRAVGKGGIVSQPRHQCLIKLRREGRRPEPSILIVCEDALLFGPSKQNERCAFDSQNSSETFAIQTVPSGRRRSASQRVTLLSYVHSYSATTTRS